MTDDMTDENVKKFDDAHATLEVLRSTSEGQKILANVEAGAKTLGASVYALAKPVAKAGGEALIAALAGFAVSSLQAELDRLGGGK